MLKFECKMSNQSKYWNWIESVGVNQNVEIWVRNVKLINMLQFVLKVWNQSKCWYLSAKCQIDQTIEIWSKW